MVYKKRMVNRAKPTSISRLRADLNSIKLCKAKHRVLPLDAATRARLHSRLWAIFCPYIFVGIAYLRWVGSNGRQVKYSVQSWMWLCRLSGFSLFQDYFIYCTRLGNTPISPQYLQCSLFLQANVDCQSFHCWVFHKQPTPSLYKRMRFIVPPKKKSTSNGYPEFNLIMKCNVEKRTLVTIPHFWTCFRARINSCAPVRSRNYILTLYHLIYVT